MLNRCPYSFLSGGSLKISLTFLKIRFFMTKGFGPRPFILKFFMLESFIVMIFVLVLFPDMLPLCFPDFSQIQVLYNKRFWSQTLYFQAFYVNILYSGNFCFRAFLRHILSVSFSSFSLQDYVSELSFCNFSVAIL